MFSHSPFWSNLRNVQSATLAVQAPTAVQAAEGAQLVNRSSVAALAFLVWDIFITLDQEVQLIWPKPWTHMKFVFFFVRYIPTLVQISILFVGTELTPHFHFTSHDCYIWQVYQGIAILLVVMAVDLILVLRVHALYAAGSVVRIIVVVCFGLEIIGMTTGLGLAIPGVKYNEICLVTAVPLTLLIYAGASILFQTLLFGLTAYKFFTAVRAGWGEIPLIVLLMRDGTWAFAVLFVVVVAYASLYGIPNSAYAGVLYGWLLTALSFCGYRVLLNINHLSQPSLRNTTTSPRTDPDLQFTTQLLSDDNPYSSNSYELSSMLTTPESRARCSQPAA